MHFPENLYRYKNSIIWAENINTLLLETIPKNGTEYKLTIFKLRNIR
jgi:hypothetical protein